MVEAVRRMEAAGFRLAVDGGKLVVTGGNPLTPAQLDWLRRHKPALLATLSALSDSNVRQIVELFDADVVAIYQTDDEHSGGVPADTGTPPPVFTR